MIILIAIILILIIVFIVKRINHSKKKVILQVGPSLKDKGGMVTVMQSIMNSNILEKYKIIHIPTYIYGKKLVYFLLQF